MVLGARLNGEAARSRFESGNRFPGDVMVSFKIHNYFKVCVSVNVCSAHSVLPWSLRLATVVAGVRGSYYRMDVRWPTE